MFLEVINRKGQSLVIIAYLFVFFIFDNGFRQVSPLLSDLVNFDEVRVHQPFVLGSQLFNDVLKTQ